MTNKLTPENIILSSVFLFIVALILLFFAKDGIATPFFAFSAALFGLSVSLQTLWEKIAVFQIQQMIELYKTAYTQLEGAYQTIRIVVITFLLLLECALKERQLKIKSDFRNTEHWLR